jgi:hypothetical protein
MAAGNFSVAEGQRARNEPASICSVLADSGPSASLSPGPSIAFFTKGGTKAPLTLLPPASTHSTENQVSIPVPANLIFIYVHQHTRRSNLYSFVFISHPNIDVRLLFRYICNSVILKEVFLANQSKSTLAHSVDLLQISSSQVPYSLQMNLHAHLTYQRE